MNLAPKYLTTGSTILEESNRFSRAQNILWNPVSIIPKETRDFTFLCLPSKENLEELISKGSCKIIMPGKVFKFQVCVSGISRQANLIYQQINFNYNQNPPGP